VLAVPDDAIEEAAAALARAGSLRGRSVLHLSGAMGLDALAPARRGGASIGSLHPLLAFPPPGRGAPIPPGAWFAVGGSGSVRTAARSIARHLRGHVIDLPERARPAWHLAAVLVANHATVLAALAMDLLERRGGLSGARIRRALASLLRSSARGIESLGPVRALSGPASRGDVATIRRHLALLAKEAPGLGGIYRALSAAAVDLARSRGDLDAAPADRLLRALGLVRRRRPARRTAPARRRLGRRSAAGRTSKDGGRRHHGPP
jgi:predicted short-subunit dehydrogenase-like oxidoreductase (DUF2520 family)